LRRVPGPPTFGREKREQTAPAALERPGPDTEGPTSDAGETVPVSVSRAEEVGHATEEKAEQGPGTGEHLSKVYHVRVLAENKAVKLVGTKPRRGSVEHFYRATRLVDDVPWGREALGCLRPVSRRA